MLLNIADIPSFTFSIDLTGTGTGAVTVVPGFVCTSSCSHDYARGANLTLTAKANTGSTFSGWKGGGCSGTGACNLTITTNVSISANFDLTPDFSISASALSPGTVSPGASATSNIDVTAVGSFDSSVSLTCSVSPTQQFVPLCSVSPTSVNPGTPATLTVKTTGPGADLLLQSHHSLSYAIWLPFCGVVLFGARRQSSPKAFPAVLLLLCVLGGTALQIACGGGGSNGGSGSNSGTSAGTYTITVTGSSGSAQHKTSVLLTVE